MIPPVSPSRPSLGVVLRVDGEVGFQHQPEDAQGAAAGDDAVVEVQVERRGVVLDGVDDDVEAFHGEPAGGQDGLRIRDSQMGAHVADQCIALLKAHGAAEAGCWRGSAGIS